jgi:ankyrin repeat protein
MYDFIVDEQDYYTRLEELLQDPNKTYVYLGNLEPILHIASRIGSLNHIETLISKGADIKKTTYWGNCLHIAAQNGNLEISKFLIEKGVEYDVEDVQGFTALLHASTQGMEEIVDFLLEKNVEVNVEGGHGRTALNRAIEYGHTNIAKKLINAGAFLNGDLRTYGRIPLTMAVLKNNEEIFRILIEKGADKNIRDHHDNHHSGKTAYELVVKHNRNDFLKYF